MKLCRLLQHLKVTLCLCHFLIDYRELRKEIRLCSRQSLRRTVEWLVSRYANVYQCLKYNININLGSYIFEK